MIGKTISAWTTGSGQAVVALVDTDAAKWLAIFAAGVLSAMAWQHSNQSGDAAHNAVMVCTLVRNDVTILRNDIANAGVDAKKLFTRLPDREGCPVAK